MIKTISAYDFERAFSDMGRQGQFTYEGKRALFEHLEQYEEDTGEEIELDVIALCCEYSEHDSAMQCVNDNGYQEFENTLDIDDDDDTHEELALDFLRDRTTVIEFGKGIIIQQF